ncbi:hypothetical protein JCM11251_001512 [Rhodosporidiobolus azoricus]
MFALPLQPIHPLSSFAEVDLRPHHSFNLHTDYLTSRRHQQRQAALEQQAHRQELARRLVRQHWEEEQAALAYRAALIRRAHQDDFEGRHFAARRRQAQLRDQRRREEERRRVLAARRHFKSAPSFLDLLFHTAPVETNDKEDSQDPPEVDLTLSRSTSPSLSVKSPFLPAQKPSPSAREASPAPSDISHISLSSDSSSAVATDSDGESASSSSDRDASLATLSTLTPSFDAPFTSSNASLLAYGDFLVSLLSDIDAVESYGDSSIRQTRKALVKRVEAELKRLDDLKEREWERQSSMSGSEDFSDESSDGEEDAEMHEDEGESNDEQDARSASPSCNSDEDSENPTSSHNPLFHHQIPFVLPSKSLSTSTFPAVYPSETDDLSQDGAYEEEDCDEDEEDAHVESLLRRRGEGDEVVWHLYL